MANTFDESINGTHCQNSVANSTNNGLNQAQNNHLDSYQADISIPWEWFLTRAPADHLRTKPADVFVCGERGGGEFRWPLLSRKVIARSWNLKRHRHESSVHELSECGANLEFQFVDDLPVQVKLAILPIVEMSMWYLCITPATDWWVWFLPTFLFFRNLPTLQMDHLEFPVSWSSTWHNLVKENSLALIVRS